MQNLTEGGRLHHRRSQRHRPWDGARVCLDDAVRDRQWRSFAPLGPRPWRPAAYVPVHQTQDWRSSAMDIRRLHVLYNAAVSASHCYLSDEAARSALDWTSIVRSDLWCRSLSAHHGGAGEGHINSTSSMAGLFAGGFMGAYNVAKHGVVALMATLSRGTCTGAKVRSRRRYLPGSDQQHQPIRWRTGRDTRSPRRTAPARKAAAGIQKMLEEQGMDRRHLVLCDTRRPILDPHPPRHGGDHGKQAAALAADQSLTGMCAQRQRLCSGAVLLATPENSQQLCRLARVRAA